MKAKAATPAQIAARKKFAERARSGELAKMRKKSTRKSNPMEGGFGNRYEIRRRGIGMAKYPIASYSDLGLAKDYLDEIDRPVGTHYGYDTKTKEVFNSFAFETRNMKRNPTATRPGRSRTKLVSNGERKSNPKKRIIVADIAGTSVPEYKAAYSVHLADRPSFHAMSYFTRKADAVETAQDIADRTGLKMAVSRVQIHFGNI